MTGQRRRLGRTGLWVSAISLGTVELGMDYGVPVGDEHRRPAEEEAARLLNAALDRGVNYMDTARAYGASEAIIGRALGTRRSEYILATKVSPPPPGAAGQEIAAHVRASLVESLRALQTDYVDVLMLHSASVDDIRRGDSIVALMEAKQAGYARFVGASTYGEEAPLLALKDGRYDCLQIAYSAVDRRMEEQVIPLAQQRDVGIVVRSVLLRGVLTHRYILLPQPLAELKGAIAALDRLAASKGSTLPELAYRYVLAHPAVATALVGTARLGEMEEALAYAACPPLEADLVAQIRRAAMPPADQLHPGNWPADLAAWQPQPA